MASLSMKPVTPSWSTVRLSPGLVSSSRSLDLASSLVLLPREEHERHQDADHADLIKVSYKTFLFLSCGVSFDDIFSLMYYSTSGEEFGNEKATYLGYINVQCVHVHNSNNLIVISRSYLTYHDTNDSRGGGV